MSKATISFFPYPGKKNSRTGKIPVYIRIILNRNKTEMRLSLDVNESELPLWNSQLMRFEDNKMLVNKLLNKLQSEFDNIVYINSNNLDKLTAKDLRDLLMGKRRSDGETLMGYFNNYYEKAIALKSTIEPGTKKNYRKAIKHLENYLKYSKQESIALGEADSAFAHNFLDYLLASIPEFKKTGMVESSASGNIKKLKAVFQRAVDEGLITRNPFAGLKLKSQARYKEKLNSIEVKALIEYNLEEFGTLDKIRDIFLFSVFTGLAYNDAISLTKSQIQHWGNGEAYLHLKRTKTGVETRQFLISQAKDIIEKYKNENHFQETLLPSISNQQLNLRLKILAEKVKITKPLTSHIARHTFRQLLSEAGLKDLAAIKTMMGHSRRNDIDAVYHSVTEKQLLEAKGQYQLFIDYLIKSK